MIRFKTFINEFSLPKLKVGDEVKVGKWKNRKAIIKGFTKDKNNQPVLKTNKGDQKLFKPRISKLEEGYMELNEVFNKPLPWKWKKRGPNLWSAEARTPDKKQLMIFINQPNPSGKEGHWTVEFKKNLSLNATGEGDAFQIFATVIAVVNDWWDNAKADDTIHVRELEFSADKESSKTDGRARLYARFAKQFAKKNNMYVDTLEKDGVTFYTVKQRKKRRKV